MNPPHRNIGLDCLRGIAILLVIGVHFHAPAPQGILGWVAQAWKQAGPVGVDLFFVLSGFLIGSLLLSERQHREKPDIMRFLIRRGFKLYPVYYLFLGYCLLTPLLKNWAGTNSHPWPAFRAQWHLLWPSLVFIQNYGWPDPLGHTWSLAVEEHFYLVLPFVILILGSSLWKYLIPLCLAFIPVCLGLRLINAWQFPPEKFAHLGQTHLHIDGLLLGVALAMLAIRAPEHFVRLGRRPLLLIVMGLLLWVAVFLPPWPEYYLRTFGYTLRILGGLLILFGTCNFHLSSLSAGHKFLAWIGVNSYATYIWHVNCIWLVEDHFGKLFDQHIGNPNERWLMLVGTIILACVGVGAAVSWLVERPALRLRDRLFPSRGRAVSVPSKKVMAHHSPLQPGASVTLGPIV